MAYFLITISIFFLTIPLDAKDFGVYGATSSIEEQDLIQFLKEKIDSYSEEDRRVVFESIQRAFVSKTKMTMEVEGIKKTKVYSVSYFDPTITVNRDILNHRGQVIVKAGTHFNPLSRVSLNQDLLFFDATDESQLNWAKDQEKSATWILIKGKPIQLESDLNRPIYFDQGGTLSKKFGVYEVPARVSQEDQRIKIEFIPVGLKK